MTPSGLASPRMAKLTSMYNFHHGVSFLSVFLVIYNPKGWLGSRVVSVLLGCRSARVQIAVATLSGNSLRLTVHTHCASVHQAAKW